MNGFTKSNTSFYKETLLSVVPNKKIGSKLWLQLENCCKFLLVFLATMLWILLGNAAANPLNPTNFTSLGVLVLTTGNYTINTSGGSPVLVDSASNIIYHGVIYNQGVTYDSNIAVFTFSSIDIGAAVTISPSGTNPVALLSRTGIDIAGAINASGTNGGDQGDGFGGLGGPGGGVGGSGSTGSGQAGGGQGPGGGPGGYDGLGNGSWGDGGSFGGVGANWNPYLTPGSTYGDLTTFLEGGSGGGGAGHNLFGSGAGGGGGGGAVELGAVMTITLEGTAKIFAEGGLGGCGTSINTGGGSGGGIFFHAPAIKLDENSLVSADGDGGGRIAFLTQSGTVSGYTNGVSVGGSPFGNPGVITYGVLPASGVQPFFLSIFLNGSDQPVISFTGISGNYYQFQRSTSLSVGGWINGETLKAPPSGAIQFTDSIPLVKMAVYRVANTTP